MYTKKDSALFGEKQVIILVVIKSNWNQDERNSWVLTES